MTKRRVPKNRRGNHESELQRAADHIEDLPLFAGISLGEVRDWGL